MTWNTSKAFEEVQNEVFKVCESSGQDPKKIRIIGVSKRKPIGEIKKAFSSGCRDFGENYLQDALPKISSLSELQADWHFVGALQSRKCKAVVENFQFLHSLDRWSLVKELVKLQEKGEELPVLLVQVNLKDESTKGGVSPQKLNEFLSRISTETCLRIEGLMFFPPFREKEKDTRMDYQEGRKIFERVGQLAFERIEMKYLSMGVSHDFPIAIEEGANILRIGTRIFGSRLD